MDDDQLEDAISLARSPREHRAESAETMAKTILLLEKEQRRRAQSI